MGPSVVVRLVVLACVAALSGCAPISARGASGPVDGGWVLVAHGFQPGELASVPSGVHVRVADGSISGSTGCNTFSAPLSLSQDGSVSVGPVLATLRSCSDAASSALESGFLAALQSVSYARLVDGELWLGGASGVLVFSAAAVSDA